MKLTGLRANRLLEKPLCYSLSEISVRHQFHTQILIIHKLGFNQNYYTFTLILLIKIVLISKFPGKNFIDY